VLEGFHRVHAQKKPALSIQAYLFLQWQCGLASLPRRIASEACLVSACMFAAQLVAGVSGSAEALNSHENGIEI